MHIRSRADCSDRTDLRLRLGRDPCVLCVCRVLCLVCAVSVPPCRLCHVFGRKEDGKGGEYSKPISLYGPVSSPTPPCLRWKIFGRLIIHLESPRPSVGDPEVISHQSLILFYFNVLILSLSASTSTANTIKRKKKWEIERGSEQRGGKVNFSNRYNRYMYSSWYEHPTDLVYLYSFFGLHIRVPVWSYITCKEWHLWLFHRMDEQTSDWRPKTGQANR